MTTQTHTPESQARATDAGSQGGAAATAEATAKAERMKAAEKESCEKYVRNGLNRNVTVQFLYERLLQMGCRPPENLIRCLDCRDAQRVGGFGVVEEIRVASAAPEEENARTKRDDSCAQTKREIDALLEKQRARGAKLRLVPEIYLCQQHLRNETHAHEAIVHELIHAVDMCR